ncbi:DinB family protein [Fulvivirga sp. M361]|uniref:DinB family protein n=1 Tax=Fulvivirga sp. M361 TaxID=2594266 RepID=UPI00117BDC1E|nr:DinB family protein [Fulvivirga sp. M361]TRX56261.1 DinB family protein [Fulvivirga sp. M361]
MTQHFKYLRTIRANLLKASDNLSLEELNKIPQGFNNNMIWNLGHIVSTYNNLIYKLSGLPGHVDPSFVQRYQKGSAPDPKTPVGQADVDYIKNSITQFVDLTEDDYESGAFDSFKEYQTSFGVILQSVEDAIIFNNVHEGLHLGYTMALKKAVRA